MNIGIEDAKVILEPGLAMIFNDPSPSEKKVDTSFHLRLDVIEIVDISEVQNRMPNHI